MVFMESMEILVVMEIMVFMEILKIVENLENLEIIKRRFGRLAPCYLSISLSYLGRIIYLGYFY